MPSDGAPDAAGGDRTSDVSVRELSELRDLLFGGERRQLEELRRRLDTLEITPEELAEKLPQAIAQRSARDDQLAIAMAPTVETAISESVRRNPHEIATAIFPVLGPAIRKAIAETMAGLVNTINRAIDHSLSPRGIRWRIESWRTGVPFAQIVIRHALVYRVEQVFLVHADTGLLLAHVPEETANADLITGMLTAIADFVNDSFETRHTGELRAFAVGDLTVLVEAGPQAYIAAVVRGQPPESLPVKLQSTLETIHLHWSNALAAFEGDSAPFATTPPLLDDCVETVLSTDNANARGFRRYAWVIPLLLFVVAVEWFGTSGRRRWNAAVARLESEPGITVIRSERSGGRWHLTGMRDPLAANPTALLAGSGIDTTDVQARWEPFVSTEPALVLARARRVLAPPASVTLTVSGDSLIASGRAAAAWIARVETVAPALPGIASVDLARLESGLPAEMDSLRGEIEGTRALFAVGSAVLDDATRNEMNAVSDRIRALAEAARRHGYDVTVQLVGRTDPSGSANENVALSRRRAVAIRDHLTSRGLPAALLEQTAIGSRNPLQASVSLDRERMNRSVSFVVRTTPLPGSRAPERMR